MKEYQSSTQKVGRYKHMKTKNNLIVVSIVFFVLNIFAVLVLAKII